MSMTAFDEIYVGAITDQSKAPKKLLQRAYNGAIIATGYAETLLSRAIRKYGPNLPVARF
ncbi:MAG: Carbon monoxide dehydrogenase/acetyl-CoA synthase subunit alpha [Dehalococcoidia bacterium]|nr:Carbon monoxide dehydrogenase/acetyl-CoA synthase subunit alpha [Bacillota bacterium]